MIVCDKCRCREICALKEDYQTNLQNVLEAFQPSTDIFEPTIRCNQYIPDKKQTEGRK